MDFAVPADIQAKLRELDDFIAREIEPLEGEHRQFFDHRREFARTDWEHDGVPRKEWEDILAEMRRRADRAGHLRFALPKELGGQNGSNLAMAVIREHLARKGLGLPTTSRTSRRSSATSPSSTCSGRSARRSRRSGI